MKERLDKVVTTPQWCEKFRDVDVYVLAIRNFDHCPLFLSYGEKEAKDLRGSEVFKFETSWMVKDAYSVVVREALEDNNFVGDPLEILQANSRRSRDLFFGGRKVIADKED